MKGGKVSDNSANLEKARNQRPTREIAGKGNVIFSIQ